MSKKERQQAHEREMQDLDALLSKMGATPAEKNASSAATSGETSSAAGPGKQKHSDT